MLPGGAQAVLGSVVSQGFPLGRREDLDRLPEASGAAPGNALPGTPGARAGEALGVGEWNAAGVRNR